MDFWGSATWRSLACLSVGSMAVGLVCTLGVPAMTSQAATTSSDAATPRAAAPRTPVRDRGPRGFRGRRGDRGPRGLTGQTGPVGDRGPMGVLGPAGPTGPSGGGVIKRNATVNWQNGRHDGRDRASVVIPGIGSAQIVCRPDTQWLRVFVDDRATDVTMWTVTQKQGEGLNVRTARHEFNTGPDFNEGFNRFLGESQQIGRFDGIISSRLNRSSAGGPGPAPTTFHLSFHWDFTDPAAARCYVAATFLTAQ